MRTIGPWTLALLALATPGWAADIYRWTDGAGNVHYSNMDAEGDDAASVARDAPVAPPDEEASLNDATGDTAPVRKIYGPKTQMLLPDAVAIDPVHGEIFVPNRNRVLVFPRDADGDVAPIRILEGPDTGLGAGRITIDPVHDLMIVASATYGAVQGRDGIRIFERTASGNTKPLRFIKGFGAKDVWLLTVNPANGMIFGVSRPDTPAAEGDISGRYRPDDFVGVWSINDDGDVQPRWTIGGPNLYLKDARGIAIDVKNKNVMVSDKTLNAVLTFNVP